MIILKTNIQIITHGSKISHPLLAKQVINYQDSLFVNLIKYIIFLVARFDIQSVSILENAFLENQRPSIETIIILSKETNLSQKQVNLWFINARRNKKLISSKTKNNILLIESFKINKYPCKEEIKNLNKLTDIEESKIKAWFSKQRFINKL